MTTNSGAYLFKDHPETCDPEDFWGQVKKTVNGKPVTQDQIDMIVSAVKAGLDLKADDVLLDLCCGNGALTTYFFQSCRGGLGVDFSTFLVEVANKHFVRRPEESYILGDIVDYVRTETDPARFTKALCYGGFQYLTKEAARQLLTELRERFTGIEHFFLGNMPDKALIADFYRTYKNGSYVPGEEDEPGSLMGVWRSEAEFHELAASSGWDAQCRKMPENFFAAYYRYDVILSRR